MQKPAAYRASVLVLLLVLMETSIKITSVDGGVCLDPGPSGTYNVACSRATAPRLIQYLLDDIRHGYLINVFPNSGTSCMNPVRDSTDHITGGGCGYVSCNEGTSSKERCTQCLESAIQVILSKCDARAFGAQASSEGCCIRYEDKSFCTP
ncbi:hypothetical protein LINGRAHAP2_LOCUS12151 [Linum grandiflorum]